MEETRATENGEPPNHNTPTRPYDKMPNCDYGNNGNNNGSSGLMVGRWLRNREVPA
ncbi:hypothetical protein DPMN_047895 [Dreissena polymorpha]|uniref:Uncharacterized protein n=1 Tax=Dreissena polymorpha TaxID=45954 RepID=A0A9D4HZK7_DREPO|nr:hypothetical protein DPMN_047895 [Dreissena polymorpha]